MGVRNGKNYVAALVLVVFTSVITLAIGKVASTVNEAPVQSAVQAEQIKRLRNDIKALEDTQRAFKKSVDEDFEEMRAATTQILVEIERVNATVRTLKKR